MAPEIVRPVFTQSEVERLITMSVYRRFCRYGLTAVVPLRRSGLGTERRTRRRVKVIGRLPGERSCLSLVWVVLDRACRGWRGVAPTPAKVRRLQQIRRALFTPDDATDPPDPT